MAIAVENAVGGNYTNSTSSHTVDWSAGFTPTAGNTLLLTLHVGPNTTRPASPPTGWAELEGGADGAPFGNVSYYKENVSSSDTSATINGWSNGGQTGRWSVIEFSGVPLSGAWGPSAKGVEASGGTTVSAGPTADLSQGTGLSIGVFVVDNGANMDGAWSSGTWTTITTQNRTTSGGHTVARRDLSGTSGISATYSGYTSDQSWIAVAALYDDAAPSGAPTISDLKAASITATTVQGTYDYAF